MTTPKVTIGLPVYNGERYVARAIESILAQTHPDFELLISDNASTDGTLDVCRRYTRLDPRVRLIENRENLGAAPNFNAVARVARGEFFKWAAHDDLLAPRFLETCYRALLDDPLCALAFTRIRRIDETGRDLGPLRFDLAWSAGRASRRFAGQILVNHWCVHVFGLIRTATLCRTRLIASYVGSDRGLLAHLSLLGKFVIVDEELFFHREHAGRSTKAIPRIRDRIGWFDARLAGRETLPHWTLLTAYLRLAASVPEGVGTRLACLTHVGRWIVRYHGPLRSDLIESFVKRRRP